MDIKMNPGNSGLDYRESMGIIEEMISRARDEHRENGDGWLLWGWLLFAASVSSVVVIQLDQRNYMSWIWTIMLVAGLLLHFGIAFLRPRKEKVTTYISALLRRLGTGFFISLLSMVAASSITGSNHGFGYYYILYAFWMFIHGSAIRFRPLIIGAVVNWIAALAIFIVADFFYTMIISAVAVLIGYLIPGYLLRQQYNKTATHK